MITGTHILLYSTDADADRAFLRDVLRFPSIDVGSGWLIFALPPAELAVHPSEGGFTQRHAGTRMIGALVYLMCDDVKTTVAELEARHVRCEALEPEAWGIRTAITLPSGGQLGLYQPTHPTAIGRQ
jgi:hypothetical protein